MPAKNGVEIAGVSHTMQGWRPPLLADVMCTRVWQSAAHWSITLKEQSVLSLSAFTSSITTAQSGSTRRMSGQWYGQGTRQMYQWTSSQVIHG